MKALLGIALLALLAPTGASETTLGAGVTLTEATPIAAIVAKPQEFVGKTIRIDGIATAVCTGMGCWMAVAASDDREGPTIRLKVEDGVVVFPVSAKGKAVSAQGVFEAIDGKDAHGKDAAKEHAGQEAKASQAYHIKATGAVIR